jgi:hypothetical protein
MRLTKTTMTLFVLCLVLSPRAARAQNLAGMIKRLFDIGSANATTPNPSNPAANIDHASHFFLGGEALTTVTRQLNVAIGQQLASFPLASSSGGFTYEVNERGEVVPTSNNFGPSFAERAVTIGRHKLNVGFTFQATSYKQFDGVDLGSGALRFISEHNDCCPAGVGNPANVTDLTPDFERDLLSSRLEATIDTKTTAFFANYGITNRFDVGIAIPIVDVHIDATVDAQILRTGSGSNPLIHTFVTGQDVSEATFSDHGSAHGLGDVLVRAKYNLYRNQGTALAAAVDLRLPTGDKDNLLGTGATQTQLFFVASSEYGRVSPHVNIGYTFSHGSTSAEAGSATSSDLHGLDIPTTVVVDQTPVDLEVPNEFNYTGGLSVGAGSRVTLGFDVRGRTIRDVPRFNLGTVSYPNHGPGPLPSATVTIDNEVTLTPGRGNLNQVLGVVDGKINIARTFLLNLTLLFPMNSNGLKPKPTPVIGFDYVF